jgi:hypothetical protein
MAAAHVPTTFSIKRSWADGRVEWDGIYRAALAGFAARPAAVNPQGAAAAPENNDALAHRRFILGHPRTLVVCLLVLAYSWATLGMTRVVPFGMVAGGRGQYIPRLEGWDLSPATSVRCLLLAPDAEGKLAVVEVRERDEPWETPRDGRAFLMLWRTTRRGGMWAPVTEQISYNARFWDERLLRGYRFRYEDRLAELMTVITAEQRGEWAALWPADGPSKSGAEVERVLWW